MDNIKWSTHPRVAPPEDRKIMHAYMRAPHSTPVIVEATYRLHDETSPTYCSIRVVGVPYGVIKTWALDTRDHAEIERSMRHMAWRLTVKVPRRKVRRHG